MVLGAGNAAMDKTDMVVSYSSCKNEKEESKLKFP